MKTYYEVNLQWILKCVLFIMKCEYISSRNVKHYTAGPKSGNIIDFQDQAATLITCLFAHCKVKTETHADHTQH